MRAVEELVGATALIVGCVLLSLQFGWKVGVGVTLLVWFHTAVGR